MTDKVPVVLATTQQVAVTKEPAEISLAGEAMLWFGIAIVGFLVIILVKAQFSSRNKIDLNDLLIDPAIGKTTQGRFWSLIGGAAGTFVFIFLAVSGHFDATYASAYLLAVFGLKVAGDITGKPTPPMPGSSESIERINRVGAPADAAAAAAIAAIQPAPGSAELLSAGRGVEPLRPAIGKEDVGKEVALVSKRNRTKPKPRKRRK